MVVIKIAIILLVSVYTIGNFNPFFHGGDQLLYGSVAIDLANGSYGFTNEFLIEGDEREFVPVQFIKTIHDTVIPLGGIGIYGLASLSYLVSGIYGLYYVGPIVTILFFIISERIVTKLFGGFVGLVTLILLSTNALIYEVGRTLLTETIFSLFLILGSFFLIKFLKEKTDSSILICSSFLTAATFFRYNGIIFLPIEILLIVGYFLFQQLRIARTKETNQKSNYQYLIFKDLFLKNKIQKFFKLALFIAGPWSIFFIFFLSYNSFFFGDPYFNYYERDEEGSIVTSFFNFGTQRLNSIMVYSNEFVPDVIESSLDFIFSEITSNFMNLSLSVFSFFILFSSLFISLYYKKKRTEIITFFVFILGILLFFSIDYVVLRTGITIRFMVPTLVFFFALIGYIFYFLWKTNNKKISINEFQKIPKIVKGFLFIIITIFLISSLYYSDPVDKILIKQNFEFIDPQKYVKRFPPDREGLTDDSIVVDSRGRRVIGYHVIPFFPYENYSEKTNSWKNNQVNQKPIEMMKEMLKNNYDLYVFKEFNLHDVPDYFRYLEEENGLILIEYSKTFCKLILVDTDKEMNSDYQKCLKIPIPLN